MESLYYLQILKQYRAYKNKFLYACYLIYDGLDEVIKACEYFPYSIHIQIDRTQLDLLNESNIPVIQVSRTNKHELKQLMYCLYVEFHTCYDYRQIFHESALRLLLPHNNTIAGYILRKNKTIVPILKDRTIREDMFRKKGVWVHSYGIGDFIINLPLLQYLIEQGKVNTFYSVGSRCDLFIKRLFPHVSSNFLNECAGYNDIYQIYLGDPELHRSYALNAKKPKQEHLLIEQCKQLHISVSKLFFSTRHLLRRSAFCQVKNVVEILRNFHKYVIAVQFVSRSTYIGKIPVKQWDPMQMKRFSAKCRAHGIAVINIESGEENTLQNAYDFSMYNLPQLLDLFLEIDLFVGIDSFGCHLAGMTSTNNIRLCGSLLSEMNDAMRLNRPVSANTDIIPSDYSLSNISAEQLFQIVIERLSEKKRSPESWGFMENHSIYHL